MLTTRWHETADELPPMQQTVVGYWPGGKPYSAERISLVYNTSNFGFFSKKESTSLIAPVYWAYLPGDGPNPEPYRCGGVLEASPWFCQEQIQGVVRHTRANGDVYQVNARCEDCGAREVLEHSNDVFGTGDKAVFETITSEPL